METAAHACRPVVRRRFLLALAGVLGCAPPILADAPEWDIDAHGVWSNGNNWTIRPAYPDAGQSAVLGGIITAPRTVTVDVPISLGWLDLDSINAYTIKGSAALTLQQGIRSLAGSHVVDTPVTLGGDGVLWADSGASAHLKKTISGNWGLTRSGSGRVIFQASNTYGGATVVTEGILEVAHSRGLGAGTGADADGTTVNRGATLGLHRVTISNEKITLNGGTIAGVNSLAVGTAGTLNGPISFAEEATIYGDALTTPIVIGGIISGQGRLSLAGVTLKAPNVYTGQTRIFGVSGTSKVIAQNSSAFGLHPRLSVEGGALDVQAAMTVDRLVLDGGSLTGSQVVTAGETVLRAGRIGFLPGGRLAGPGPVVKASFGDVWLYNCTCGPGIEQAVEVRQGTLRINAVNLAGMSKPAYSVTSAANAAIDVRSNTLPNEVRLGNGTGMAYSGALVGVTMAGTDYPIVAGDVALGARGSLIGGKLMLTGGISGGGLTKVGDGPLAIAGSASTYTGATIIGGSGEGSMMILTGEGTLGGTSSIVVHGGAGLTLDNATLNRPDRVADGIPIHLRGGLLAVVGNSAAEGFGAVHLEHGASAIRGGLAGNEQDCTLTLARLERNDGATVAFGGGPEQVAVPSKYLIQEAPSVQGGIMGGWATVSIGAADADFATYDAQKGVIALGAAGRPAQVLGALASDNVRVIDASLSDLTEDTEVNSLNFTGAAASLNLAGHALRVVSGGVMRGGDDGMTTIANGRLTAGGGELFLHMPATVDADIVDDEGGAVSLVAGGGEVRLNGANSYTGATVVNSGSLHIGSAGAIPSNNAVRVDGGRYVLAYESAQAVRLGLVMLREGGAIEAQGLAVNAPAMDADGYAVESGNLAVRLSGTGAMTKTTHGTARLLADNAGYGGAIRVEGGMLVGDAVGSPLGTGPVTVAGGRLVMAQGSTGNALRLEGGELAGSKQGEQIFGGAVEVTGEAAVLTFDGLYTPGSAGDVGVPTACEMRFAGPVTIEAGGRLAALGDGVARFEGGVAGAGALEVATKRVSVVGLDGVRVEMRSGTLLQLGGEADVAALVLPGASGAWEAQVDLVDQRLGIAPGEEALSDVLARVNNQLRSGRNGGTWDGQGITSSLVGEVANHGVGVAAAGDEVIVALTWEGDTTVDGIVSTADFAALSKGYVAYQLARQSGQAYEGTWSGGDFNYDGMVGTADFALLSKGYVGYMLERQAAVSGTAVPEPGVLGVAALAGLLGLRRGRRC